MKLKRILIAAAVLVGVGVLIYKLIADGEREQRRRLFARRAIDAASALMPEIQGRIEARGRETAINEGLRVQPTPPITDGYVARDGTIVVMADLDPSVPFTVILRPDVDAQKEIHWTCGVATQEQSRYANSICSRVSKVPDSR